MGLLSFLAVVCSGVLILFIHIYLVLVECTKVFILQFYVASIDAKDDSRTTANVFLLLSVIGYATMIVCSNIKIRGIRLESLLVIFITLVLIVVIRLIMRKYNTERFSYVLPCINLLSIMALADVIILGLVR